MGNSGAQTAKARRGLAENFRINQLGDTAPSLANGLITLAIIAIPAAIIGVWAWRRRKRQKAVKRVAEAIVAPAAEKLAEEILDIVETMDDGHPPAAAKNDPTLPVKLVGLVESGETVWVVSHERDPKGRRQHWRGCLTTHITAGDIYVFAVQDGRRQVLFTVDDIVRTINLPRKRICLVVRAANN